MKISKKKKFFELGPFLKKFRAKNWNSLSFKRVIKIISKFTRKSFFMGTKKNVLKWRKSKIKIFQIVRFGVECPSDTSRNILIALWETFQSIGRFTWYDDTSIINLTFLYFSTRHIFLFFADEQEKTRAINVGLLWADFFQVRLIDEL